MKKIFKFILPAVALVAMTACDSGASVSKTDVEAGGTVVAKENNAVAATELSSVATATMGALSNDFGFTLSSTGASVDVGLEAGGSVKVDVKPFTLDMGIKNFAQENMMLGAHSQNGLEVGLNARLPLFPDEQGNPKLSTIKTTLKTGEYGAYMVNGNLYVDASNLNTADVIRDVFDVIAEAAKIPADQKDQYLPAISGMIPTLKFFAEVGTPEVDMTGIAQYSQYLNADAIAQYLAIADAYKIDISSILNFYTYEDGRFGLTINVSKAKVLDILKSVQGEAYDANAIPAGLDFAASLAIMANPNKTIKSIELNASVDLQSSEELSLDGVSYLHVRENAKVELSYGRCPVNFPTSFDGYTNVQELMRSLPL